DRHLETRVLPREQAFAQVVVVGARLDEAVAFDDGGVADKPGGLADQHADQQDKETRMKNNAGDLRPERTIALLVHGEAAIRRWDPDKHTGANRDVHENRRDDERPRTENVEEPEPRQP